MNTARTLVHQWARCGEGQRNLLFFIESGNSYKVSEMVHNYFEFYRGQPAASIQQLKENCRLIIAEVRALLSAYFLVENSQQSSSSLEAVLKVSFDAEEIRTYFVTVLTSSAELLKEQSVYASPSIIDNIKLYIDKNIDFSISLEHLSNLFLSAPAT